MYCILIYREHDADTSVNGPYSKLDEALKARDRLAADIVGRRMAAGNPSTVNPPAARKEWDDEIIVYDPDYEHEPTDDDWHVTLRVEHMTSVPNDDALADAQHSALVDKGEIDPDSRC
jgi:hypothetical protein